jgi:zinc transport system ATP-binding protein
MSAAIETNDVSVQFGDFTALRNITFSLPVGSFLAIIGPNGAGKTTLLNLLTGMRQPTLGTVRVLDRDPAALDRDAIGYIPQVKTLDRHFPARALELVVTGTRPGWPWRVRAAERAAAMRALERAGAAHVADRPLSALSGGELQRVYLARCLMRPSKLLVLDEPGAGLDLAGAAAMHHVIEEYIAEYGATAVMITHDWEGARNHASHILLLNKEMVAFGPAREAATDERLLNMFGYAGHLAKTHGNHDA